MTETHPDWLADRFLAAATTLPLPQMFEVYERAVAFAELRGWGQGTVRVFGIDGGYRVVPGDEPCGCDGAREVSRETPEGDELAVPSTGDGYHVPEVIA